MLKPTVLLRVTPSAGGRTEAAIEPQALQSVVAAWLPDASGSTFDPGGKILGCVP